jgi:16S rRNA U516 pseudouridylate synthase RsuA-like enzyme
VGFSQGRLDKDTTGLLLFSRDGDLTNSLLLPTSGVEREYRAVVDGAISIDEITAKLAAGEWANLCDVM